MKALRILPYPNESDRSTNPKRTYALVCLNFFSIIYLKFAKKFYLQFLNFLNIYFFLLIFLFKPFTSTILLHRMHARLLSRNQFILLTIAELAITRSIPTNFIIYQQMNVFQKINTKTIRI